MLMDNMAGRSTYTYSHYVEPELVPELVLLELTCKSDRKKRKILSLIMAFNPLVESKSH